VYLDLSVNNSLAGIVTPSPTPDADGLVPAGSTITAAANPGYSFGYWLVDGINAGNANPLTINTHTVVQAVFNRAVTASSFGDSGSGTLRYALTNAQDGDIISFSGVQAGITAIELESPLPTITKSITIEGNGLTLTRAASWTTVDNTSQLLYINSSSAEVTIRGVHFKNGLATDYGGAIRNSGTLSLESCIFSGNRATGGYAHGGAIYSSNTLSIRGCTFYGNTSGYYGGAVSFIASGKTLTLTGNLFYGNTATNGYPVVYSSGTVSASYNVVDVELGTGSARSGWAAGTGDTYSSGLLVSSKTFKVLDGSPAAAVLPGTLPAAYPATDFYGQPVSGGGAAGAIQTLTANGYVYLDLSVNNSQMGSVTASLEPDEDGLVPAGSLTLTAIPNPACSLACWLVDGVETAGTGTNQLTINLTAHTRIQAVLIRPVTVTDFSDGAGSAAAPTLRYALTNAQDDDVISFSGVQAGITAIELESPLPTITKSITIEGNGLTLTRAVAVSWTASETSQLLYINSSSAEVTIRGVYFKNGVATQYGGAIRNTGTLSLESCIFSGNRTISSYYIGGAIYSSNTLSIRGCTFYGNNTSYRGGAVCFAGKTLTLEGNLFYGNTATNSYPVVYRSGGTVSASYNVVDVALGTGSAQSGWAAGTGDKTTLSDGDGLTISGAPFDTATFVPVNGLQSFLLSSPADFPATDFYGTTRTFPGAPGAVAAAP
jgi:predicted outer membrane repeat protein